MKLVNVLIIVTSFYALGLAVGCKKNPETQSTPSLNPLLPSPPTVYIAGYHGTSAAYWKNGKLFTLANGTYAHSICVVGNDVYVAGEDNSEVGLRAVYWKNGTPVPLTKSIAGF